MEETRRKWNPERVGVDFSILISGNPAPFARLSIDRFGKHLSAGPSNVRYFRIFIRVKVV